MVIFGLCSFMFVMFESSGSGYLFFSVVGSDKHMWRYARSEEVGQQHFKLIVKSTFLEFVQATRVFPKSSLQNRFIVGFFGGTENVSSGFKWHRCIEAEDLRIIRCKSAPALHEGRNPREKGSNEFRCINNLNMMVHTEKKHIDIQFLL